MACHSGAASGTVFDPTPRYIRNGRDLAEWLHRDFSIQAGVNTALMLLSPAFGPAALDAGNPYLTSLTQGSFVTFGPPHVIDLVARVANAALRAAWYQKWLVHRRVRPEAFGARVHNHVTGVAIAPIHSELLGSEALSAVFSAKGTYLLPMAYAEGCPAHPAYPAGHAAFIGAMALLIAPNLSHFQPRVFRDQQSRLYSEVPATLQEIADSYGITRERVRQIEERVVEKLKTFFKEKGFEVDLKQEKK